jgi:hypothetical protein
LPYDPINVGTDNDARTILWIQEWGEWTAHRIEHVISKVANGYQSSIRYTITWTKPGIDATDTWNTFVSVDVLNDVWLHVTAKHKIGLKPTLDVELGGTTIHGPLANVKVYDSGHKTNCTNQVLGIGGRPSLYTMGTAPYCTVHPTEGLLSKLGLRGIGGKGLVIDDLGYYRSFSGILAEINITDKNGCSVLHLKFDESQGAKYVIDRASGLMIAPPPEVRIDVKDDRGTLDAVYDFLENICDVRWYAPMDIGVVYPIQPTIEVYVLTGKRIASMPFGRHIMQGQELLLSTPDPLAYNFWGSPSIGCPLIPERDTNIWKLRMRIGGQEPIFGHNLHDLPSGSCLRNKTFINSIVTRAKDYLRKPESHLFSLRPADSFAPCQDEQTTAYVDNPRIGGVEVTEFQSQRLSDYVFTFTNDVAQQVMGSYPKKMVGAEAYNDHAFPPDSGKTLQANTVLAVALSLREWCRYAQEIMDKLVLYAWEERLPKQNLVLYVYYSVPLLHLWFSAYNGGPVWHFFPGFNAHVAVKQMTLFQKLKNISGIWLEHTSGCGASYLMDQLELYVILRLAHNSLLNGEAMINEFFTYYYGVKAGPVMKSLYQMIEDTYMDPDNYPAYWKFPKMAKSLALGNTGDVWDYRQDADKAHSLYAIPGLGAKLYDLMEEAKKLAIEAENLAITSAMPDEVIQRSREKTRITMFEQGVWDYMKVGFKDAGVVIPP